MCFMIEEVLDEDEEIRRRKGKRELEKEGCQGKKRGMRQVNGR